MSPAELSTVGSTSVQSNSSSEASSPRTPLDDIYTNVDRRYVYIPEKGIEIPLTYDEPRTPKYEKQPPVLLKTDDSRGRNELSRLDTNLPATDPSNDRPSGHERAPSPYACIPQPSRFTTKPSLEETLGSGHSAKLNEVFHSGGRNYRKQRRRGATVSSGEGGRTRPIRPSMNRYVSDMVSPGEHSSIGDFGTAIQSPPYPVSSDESDDELAIPPTGQGVGFFPPQSPPKYSKLHLEDFAQQKSTISHRAKFPPVAVVSLHQKEVPPNFTRTPSSPGTQYGHSFNTGLRLQHGDMPPASPDFSHQNQPHANSEVPNESTPLSNSQEIRSTPQSSACSFPPSPPPVTPDKKHIYGTGQTINQCNFPSIARSPSKPFSEFEAAEQLLGPPETRNPDAGIQNPSRPVSIVKRQQSHTRSRSPSLDIEEDNYIHAPPNINIREPSPARPESIIYAVAGNVFAPSSTHTPLTPFLTQPSDKSEFGGRRRALSNVETRPKLSFSEARSETLILPPRSLRDPPRSLSHHRTVSSGSQPLALLPCPRPSPVAGFTDWYSLIGHRSFSICPSCRRAVSGAGYEKHFEPSRPEPAGYERRCDMSNTWMRMAMILTISTKRPDPKLMYALADIIVDELSCPGKALTTGQWYRVESPDSGRQVSGFDICPGCVRNVETMFPTLRGGFRKSRSRNPDQERSCDLRADSKRFATFVDLLESTAKQAQEFRRPPNMLRFADLAEQMAAIPECGRDDMLLDRPWHTIMHIPELTVCEDCYREVVRPAARQGYSVAAHFSRKAQRTGLGDVGSSCQMYSARMRSTFKEACRRDDLARLKSVAMQRHQIEAGLQRRIREVQRADITHDERFEKIQGLVEEWKRWE